jgi:hypothetical protein
MHPNPVAREMGALGTWVNRHPWMTFFIVGGTIGGILTVAQILAAGKAAATATNASAGGANCVPATSLTQGHIYKMTVPGAPPAGATLQTLQSDLDQLLGPGVVTATGFTQAGSTTVFAFVYNGAGSMPLSSSALASASQGGSVLDCGAAS